MRPCIHLPGRIKAASRSRIFLYYITGSRRRIGFSDGSRQILPAAQLDGMSVVPGGSSFWLTVPADQLDVVTDGTVMPTEMCRHSNQGRENCWSQDGCDYANNKYDGYPCKNSCKDAGCIVSNRVLRFLILSMEQACLITRKRQIRA